MNYIEIEDCVMRSRQGDHKEMLKIMEQYKFFIYKTAAQFNIKNYDFYDLMQIANIALLNAVHKYKLGSHTFSTYAYTAIKNSLKFTARQNAKYNSEISLNVPVNNEDDNSAEFLDCIESMVNLEEEVLHSENIAEIRSIISILSYDEMELIKILYYNKCTLRSYADSKGITYDAAVRKKNRILKKLRNSIAA